MLWIESVKKGETGNWRIPDVVRMLTEGRKQRGRLLVPESELAKLTKPARLERPTVGHEVLEQLDEQPRRQRDEVGVGLVAAGMNSVSLLQLRPGPPPHVIEALGPQRAPKRVGIRLPRVNATAGTGPQPGRQPGILEGEVHQQNSPVAIHDKRTNRVSKTKITRHGAAAPSRLDLGGCVCSVDGRA